MTLEHYIEADNKRRAVIVVKDSSGRTYKLERDMGKDRLLEYIGKVSELWESAEAQEIGEKMLNRVRRTAAELKDAIEQDDGKVQVPTFSEFKMASMAYIIVKTYRGAAAEKPLLARAGYGLSAQDSTIGEIVQQLGKSYRTAASGYRNRDPFDDYIKKIATDLDLDGNALVEFLHQAYPVQEKQGKRGFTSTQSIKARLRGKPAPASEKEEPSGLMIPRGAKLEPDGEVSQEAPPTPEPEVSKAPAGQSAGLPKDGDEEGTNVMSKEAIRKEMEEIAKGSGLEGVVAKEPKPAVPAKRAPEVYAKRPEAKTPTKLPLSEQKPAEAVQKPERTYGSRRLARMKEKKNSGFVKKAAIVTTLAAILGFGGATAAYTFVPSTREYLGSQRLSYLGKAIEESSNWIRKIIGIKE